MTQVRPDISTSEGRAAYRKELRQVARLPRFVGLGFILLGAALAVWPSFSQNVPEWTQVVAYVALGIGWMVIVYAIITRTRYHRRRMSQEP